ALGQIGESRAAEPLRALLQTEGDPFVKAQAEKALAALHPAGPPGGPPGANKKAKIFLSFGPFTGTVKSIDPDAAKLVRDVLQRELAKLSTVTLSLTP